MQYTENYLKGANMLDSEMEQFDHNPADFVSSMGWTKTNQKKAEKVRGKLTLVVEDYKGLEKVLDDVDGDYEHDDVQDYITNLFAGKILAAMKK